MSQTIELLLVVLILALLVEVSYLVVKLPRQNLSRKQARPILIDTSVLIDGRIIAVAQSGFIGDTLVIPRSVIGELQFLADNADHEKRARARYGLDVVTELQNMPHVDVEILQDGSKAQEGVDERLLSLAKKHGAVICTIDYNLNKVAIVEGLTVLNVNELAQSLRMAYLPGEKLLLELVQKGQGNNQGVGYLPDGTMVVVEQGLKHIGQSVEVEFIRSLQTAAGKMMFAKLVEQKQQATTNTANILNSKPTGKKPVQQGANTNIKQPTVVAKPQQQSPQQSQSKQTSVYHSDRNDRQQVKKQQNKKPNNNQQQRPTKKSSKKSPTSADREAAFLDLVDKQ